MLQGATQKSQDSKKEKNHNYILSFDGPACAEKCQHEQCRSSSKSYNLKMRHKGGIGQDQGLGKTKDIKGNRKGQGKKECYTDGTAELNAEHPGDEKIGATTTHPHIGADGCN